MIFYPYLEIVCLSSIEKRKQQTEGLAREIFVSDFSFIRPAIISEALHAMMTNTKRSLYVCLFSFSKILSMTIS
jgi:hypothetical protein